MSENQIASKQEQDKTPKKYLEFDYNGKRYEIRNRPLFDHKGKVVESFTGRPLIALDIIDENRIVQGHMVGQFIKDGFKCNSLENRDIDDYSSRKIKKLEGHVPGLVRESIAQMLVQEKIKKWESSEILLEGGVITYENLLKDSRLTGTKNKPPRQDFEKGEDRYQYTILKR